MRRILSLMLLASMLWGQKWEHVQQEYRGLLAAKDYEAAEAFLETLIPDLKGRDKIQALVELADLQYHHLFKPEKALVNLLRARAVSGDKGYMADGILYRLGLVYQKLGLYVEAARAFEAVATRYPKSPYRDDAMQMVERAFEKNFQDVIAVVAGVPITTVEFDRRLEEVPSFFRAEYNTPEGKKKLLDQIIDEILMLRDAEAKRVYLRADVRERLDRLYMRTLTQGVYEEEVKNKVEVTDEEVRQYYEAHKEDYRIPARARVRRIVVNDRDTAERVLQLLKAGHPFDSLAREYSVTADAKNGGLMGTITIKSRPPEIARVAFRLQPGEISDIIALADGRYAIIKVESRDEGGYQPLEEVQNTIRSTLQRQKEQKRWEEYRKELRERYGVKIYKSFEEEGEGEGK